MIKEDIIDKVIVTFEDAKNYEEGLHDFLEEQPYFAQFIATENFKLLKEEEFDLLCFILSVIHTSVALENEEYPDYEGSLIDELDELNWSVYNDKTNKNFRNVVDLYFESYEEEDLLAFVEDSLQSDDDFEISSVGKEIIFITCKTYIDILIHTGKSSPHN